MLYEKLLAAAKEVKEEMNKIVGSEKLIVLLLQEKITSKENFRKLLDDLVDQDIIDILNISLQLYALKTIDVREEYITKLNEILILSHLTHGDLNSGQYVDYNDLEYCDKLIYELCLLFEVGELNITK